MSNTVLRIVTALIGVPVIVGVLYLGSWYVGALVAVAALIAQSELYAMMRHAGLRPFTGVGYVLGALLLLRPLVPELLPIAIVLSVGVLLASPFFRQEGVPLNNVSGTFFGAFYPSALLAFITDLRIARGPLVEDLDAFVLTLSTFALIWATDTFAYVCGRSFGKRPLAPFISPKKTWEGSAGGALSAVLVAVGLKLTVLPMLSWIDVGVLALITGVVSQFGDLAESHLKRSVGVKDSGTILPGHGGLLDRLDAMIVAVPLVYLYLAMATDLIA